MTGLDRSRRPKPLALFAWSALLSAAALCLPAQERRVLPRDGVGYMPLRAGASWHYRRTAGNGVSSEVEVRCRGPVAAGKWTAFELISMTSERTEFDYWSANAEGVWRHTTASQMFNRGMPSRQPGCWLPAPVGVRTTWEWTQLARPQSGSGTWGPVSYRGTIETFADTIAVPAGKFDAVKLSVEFLWPETEDGERDVVWLVPGTGIVRHEEYGIEGGRALLRYRDDLVKFVPGPESMPDPIEVAARFVAAHAALWPDGPPKLAALPLPLDDSVVATRFVLATTPTDRTLVATCGDDAYRVDLEDLASLQTLWRAEAVQTQEGAVSSSGDLSRFGKLCVSLRRAVAGGNAAPVRFRSTRLTGRNGPDGVAQSATLDDGTWKIQLESKDGKLLQAKLTPK